MTFVQLPEEQWSDSERWVWQEICAGRIADFNLREGRQDEDRLDSTTSKGWGEARKLRSEFLKQILFRQPYSSQIPVEGVRIVGAWFDEDKGVELEHGGRLGHQLWLENCRFEGPANLAGLQIEGWFSLEGSTFAGQGTGITSVDLDLAKIIGLVSLSGATFNGKLIMNGLEVGQSLFMDAGATFKDVVNLANAKVGGRLSMSDATFEGQLNMNSLDVAQHLFMGAGATFKDVVNLANAKVGGQLDMSGATFKGQLIMNGLEVAQHLFMRAGATFKDVVLAAAKVGGQLDMSGATFEGQLNMNSLDVAQYLIMRGGATFKDVVDLTTAKVGVQLSLDGATFDGQLIMNGLEVAQHLFMGAGATFKDVVNLANAKVGGQLDMSGATFEGQLIMNGLDVAQYLIMRGGATFKDVDLANAKVGSQLDMSDATFEGQLIMHGLEVAQHLFMRAGATFKDVVLTTAKVGGQLDMSGATFEGQLIMESLVVEEDVFMRRLTFNETLNETVSLIFAHVGRNLDLSESELTGLDLSGARIEGELRLGSNQHPRTRWRKDAALNLRNVHAGALQDRRDRGAKLPWWWRMFGDRERWEWEDAWPAKAKLQLDGFTYDRLGGFGGMSEGDEDSLGDRDVDVDMQARDIRWYIDWLDRDHSYSPQPYEQLAGVFRAAGDPTKSNRILYES